MPAGEVRYRLPREAAPAFPPLLRALQREGPRLGVGPYGLAVTTLEEVFLRVSEAATAAAEPGAAASVAAAKDSGGGGGGGAVRDDEGPLLVHLPRYCYLRVSMRAEA